MWKQGEPNHSSPVLGYFRDVYEDLTGEVDDSFYEVVYFADGSWYLHDDLEADEPDCWLEIPEMDMFL